MPSHPSGRWGPRSRAAPKMARSDLDSRRGVEQAAQIAIEAEGGSIVDRTRLKDFRVVTRDHQGAGIA